MQIVKNGLPKKISKTLNVLTVKDDVLFTWDFQNHCVLTLNIKAARENKGVNCQVSTEHISIYTRFCRLQPVFIFIFGKLCLQT